MTNDETRRTILRHSGFGFDSDFWFRHSDFPMGFLDREHSIAPPGYNRWLVPPAALAVHLSIGQAYAFSVFKIPLTQVLGVTKHLPEDWRQPPLVWIFSIAMAFLGISAAAFGK